MIVVATQVIVYFPEEWDDCDGWRPRTTDPIRVEEGESVPTGPGMRMGDEDRHALMAAGALIADRRKPANRRRER